MPTASFERVLAKAIRRLATESSFANVINGSATRRNSLAFGKVVLIAPCSNRETVMLRNIASRCALVRFYFLPLLRCRMVPDSLFGEHYAPLNHNKDKLSEAYPLIYHHHVGFQAANFLSAYLEKAP